MPRTFSVKSFPRQLRALLPHDGSCLDGNEAAMHRADQCPERSDDDIGYSRHATKIATPSPSSSRSLGQPPLVSLLLLPAPSPSPSPSSPIRPLKVRGSLTAST
eukprot:757628-Hanusia_phi.AAC.6